MKVKCIRILNIYGEDVELSPWITVGRVYHVMSIKFKMFINYIWEFQTILFLGL